MCRPNNSLVNQGRKRPRSLNYTHILVAIASLDSFTLFGQALSPISAAIDQNRLWEVEQLVVRLPNDSVGALESLNVAEKRAYQLKSAADEQARLIRIQTDADIAPYLIALADKYLAEESRDGLPMIMRAIATRKDIPPTEINRFITLAGELIENPSLKSAPILDDFLIGMTSVMAVHPSPTTEALLLKMLRMRNDFTGVVLKLSAGEALSICGSPDALAAMRVASTWFYEFAVEVGDPTTVAQAREFEGYMRRVQDRDLKNKSPNFGASIWGESSKKSEHLEGDHDNKLIAPRFELVVLILITTFLLWLFLKNRK